MSRRVARGRRADRNHLPVERLVASVLLWGGVASVALVLIGLGLYAQQGGFRAHVLDLHRAVRPARHAHPADVFVSLREVFRGLAAHPIDPLAVTALGLVLLLLTPLLGVALAIPGFLAVGDRRYAAIAAIVLGILVLGTLLSRVG